MKAWIPAILTSLAIAMLAGCSSKHVPQQSGADLVITQRANRTSVETGEQIIFTITVTNRGPNNASEIVFGDLLPADLKLVSCSCSAGSGADGAFCELDHLGSGKSAVATVIATPMDEPTQSNITLTAKAVIPEYLAFDPNRENNSATVTVQIVPKTLGETH